MPERTLVNDDQRNDVQSGRPDLSSRELRRGDSRTAPLQRTPQNAELEGEKKPSRFVVLAKVLIPVLTGLLIYILPCPESVQPAGWTLLSIFVATVVALILQPAPLGVIALVGMTLTLLSGAVTEEVVLSGFSNSVIWLAAMAFFIARAFTKTGLGRRIALLFVRLLGKRSLGLGYGLAITDLLLAPAMPSVTARAGGIVYPVAHSLADLTDSKPGGPSRRRLGAFLSATAMQVNVVTAAMFATAMAANPLVQKFAKDQGVEISWGTWALAALVPGLISVAVIPLLVYFIYPPEVRATPEAPKEARRQLAQMGPVSRNEWILLGTFGVLLFLWTAGNQMWGLSATTGAFVGVVLLLITGVLKWDDLLAEKSAWTTVIWFAALIMMAGQLLKLGVINWFSSAAQHATSGMGWPLALLLLLLAYFYSHYLFASNTAHIAAMYLPFLATAVAAGAPAMLAALAFGFASSLFGGLTHYASGPSPVLFGSGYVSMSEWWRVGLITSVANVVIWLVAGGAWLWFLGYW